MASSNEHVKRYADEGDIVAAIQDGIEDSTSKGNRRAYQTMRRYHKIQVSDALKNMRDGPDKTRWQRYYELLWSGAK